MTYVYQHYPLALYRKGEYMAVANETEEARARAEGWTDYTTDRDGGKPEEVEPPKEPDAPRAAEEQPTLPPIKRGPGRPRKQ